MQTKCIKNIVKGHTKEKGLKLLPTTYINKKRTFINKTHKKLLIWFIFQKMLEKI